jgi:hypothetical protein
LSFELPDLTTLAVAALGSIWITTLPDPGFALAGRRLARDLRDGMPIDESNGATQAFEVEKGLDGAT